MSSSVNKTRISYLLAAVAAGAAGYALYRFLTTPRTTLAPQVGARLPITKNLPTVPDTEANYDIDGVSFDDDGTVVSGDNSKSLH